jgi:hypothetical protein
VVVSDEGANLFSKPWASEIPGLAMEDQMPRSILFFNTSDAMMNHSLSLFIETGCRTSRDLAPTHPLFAPSRWPKCLQAWLGHIFRSSKSFLRFKSYRTNIECFHCFRADESSVQRLDFWSQLRISDLYLSFSWIYVRYVMFLICCRAQDNSRWSCPDATFLPAEAMIKEKNP